MTLVDHTEKGGKVLLTSWHRATAVFVLSLALMLVLFWGTLTPMVATWNSSDSFQHCYFVLPFVLYLVWDSRAHLASYTPKPDMMGLAVLLLGSLGWLIGYAASVQLAQELSLVGMLEGLILAIFGRQIFLAMKFPMIFLFLLVPMGEFLVPALRDWTAQFLVWSVDILGYNITSDGYFFTVTQGVGSYLFEVAKECSGIRYLTVMFAIGLATAYLFFDSLWHRLGAIALAVALPIIANWVRALGIVILAVETEGRHGTDVDHLIYGFWFFLAILLFYIIICWRLAKPLKHQRIAAVPALAPSDDIWRLRQWIVACLVLPAILWAPVYASSIVETEVETEVADRPSMSAPLAGWREVQNVQFDWQPYFSNATYVEQQRFRSGFQDVDVYVAYYHQQSGETELIRHGNKVITPPWKRMSASGSLTKESLQGPVLLPVHRMEKNGRKRLVAYFYWVDGQLVISTLKVKALTAKIRLLGGKKSAGVVAFSARYFGDPDKGMLALGHFVRQYDVSGLVEG